ncbi:hypothetical protein [Brevibacterium oceani]|uniref:hypothetical protein n=1 Tax=Brevibacterium oceani TaxID=358099 RepID=UPI0015E7E2CC|nr:hypothetical protein [Brevibacterium oceani]
MPASHERGAFALRRTDIGAHLTMAGLVTLSLTEADLDDLRALLDEAAPAMEAAGGAATASAAAGKSSVQTVRSVPTPAELAPKCGSAQVPVFSTVTGDEPPESAPLLSAESIKVLPGVQPFVAEFGLDPADLAEIINDPEDEWLDDDGTKSVHLRGDHAVVLGLADETVVSVIPRSRALRNKPVSPGMPRGRGGQGTRYPTSMNELEELLRARGAEITFVSSGHRRVDFDGRSSTLVTTPSDHRSLRNTITQLEKGLGLDLRRDSVR